MSPEYIGSNMWNLLEGECVIGRGGKIQGPAIVRVYEYPEIDSMMIQGGNKKVEVDGLDFAAVVSQEQK